MDEDLSEDEKLKLQILSINVLLTTIFHPIEYAKTLSRLGYEPLEAQKSKTFLGYPAMMYPNIFQYIKYIKSSDGFFGCFTGLSPRYLGMIASITLTDKVALKAVDMSGYNLPEINDPPNILNDEEPNVEDYIKNVRRELIFRTAFVVVSQPFEVVSIRMMASFIGKDEQYKSILRAIISTFRDDGIFGFFSGVIPKLIGDSICICLTGFLSYYVNKYLLKTKEQREFTEPVLALATSGFSYPFYVVSTCMSVVGSSLKAGNPPTMPNYSDWFSCWRHLVQTKQINRGSGIIYRVATTANDIS